MNRKVDDSVQVDSGGTSGLSTSYTALSVNPTDIQSLLAGSQTVTNRFVPPSLLASVVIIRELISPRLNTMSCYS